ncbi:hypothetical protein J14TS2_46300 [Bacillus sp. J14TS2]|nr:hypothetical protein J14TS2_46300 [Bacillus sp. J14TS2]
MSLSWKKQGWREAIIIYERESCYNVSIDKEWKGFRSESKSIFNQKARFYHCHHAACYHPWNCFSIENSINTHT